MRLSGLLLLLTVLSILLAAPACFAQVSRSITRTGTVILNDEDTINANFTVDLQENLIEVSLGSTIRTFSARQVNKFNYTDESGQEHRFYTIPFAERGTYKIPTYFETVYTGKALSLLMREQLVLVTMPTYDAMSQRSITRTSTRLVQDFYFRTEKGFVKRYRFTRKELYALMPDREDEIKAYMKQNNIGYVNRDDLVRITQFYNSTVEKTAVPADSAIQPKPAERPADEK